MARGQEGGSKCDPFYAKIVQKGANDERVAIFQLTKPNPDFDSVLAISDDNPKTISDGVEETLAGKIIGIVTTRYDYKGDDKLSAKLILEDVKSNEIYHIQFGQSGIARNIINSLAGINDYGWVSIGLWLNKKGYPTVGVRNNNEKTAWEWKPYGNDENEYLDKIVYVNDPKLKKDVPNFWALDEWLFETIIPEINKKIKVCRENDPPEEENPKDEVATAAPVEDGTKEAVEVEQEKIVDEKPAAKKTAKGKKGKKDGESDDLPF